MAVCPHPRELQTWSAGSCFESHDQGQLALVGIFFVGVKSRGDGGNNQIRTCNSHHEERRYNIADCGFKISRTNK